MKATLLSVSKVKVISLDRSLEFLVATKRRRHLCNAYTTPTLYEQCVGSLTSHSINIGKDCETGPTVFRPYPRRLESLTICRCHYKGSTFFSVIVKTLSVGPAGA